MEKYRLVEIEKINNLQAQVDRLKELKEINKKIVIEIGYNFIFGTINPEMRYDVWIDANFEMDEDIHQQIYELSKELRKQINKKTSEIEKNAREVREESLNAAIKSMSFWNIIKVKFLNK